MYNPLGYKALKTFQQAEEIYFLTKSFCSVHLYLIDDHRIISHLNDSARSIKQNIAEGHGRGSTRANIEFLGFAMGSLSELLEDFFDLEKDFKEGLRKTRKDKEETLAEISKIIKHIMGEKTMMQRQIESLEKRFIEQGDEKERLKQDRDKRRKQQIVNIYRRHW